jgi:hypothetical protein
MPQWENTKRDQLLEQRPEKDFSLKITHIKNEKNMEKRKFVEWSASCSCFSSAVPINS